MKKIEGKEYYKMSELVNITNLSNFTISFYSKKGLLPNGVNTSKNMKYYPKITGTVLNLIVYFKESLGFSIDSIKDLFDYYKVDFENREEFLIQAIEMMSVGEPDIIPRVLLEEFYLKEAVQIGLLQEKDEYFKTELEVLKTFAQLIQYDLSSSLIKEYIQAGERLANIERELGDKVFAKVGELPEILVLDILNKLKPFILNSATIKAYKEWQ